DGVGEPDACAVDLTCTRGAAQLPNQLDNLADTGRAERFALRQQPAAGVHRASATERDHPVSEQLRLLARRAQPELLVGEQLTSRVGVLALDDVDVTGADAGRRVGD